MEARASDARKPRRPLGADVENTEYDVVRAMAIKAGFDIENSDQESFLIWHDLGPPMEVFCAMKGYQRINHFPGTKEISRKDNLARNLVRMQKLCPEHYGFFPRTWILPAESTGLETYHKKAVAAGKTPVYIAKPINLAQGKGISLTFNPMELVTAESRLVQEYMRKPFLLDGFKFDLRVYLLVTSITPLRAFMYKDGLVRMSTLPYEAPTPENADQLFMHLTNYAINKHNDDFVMSNEHDKGSKRSIKWMMDYLKSTGRDIDALWQAMGDIMLKTVIASLPDQRHQYRICFKNQTPSPDDPSATSQCFEILGFDIILDRHLVPHVLEVNRAPSLSCDQPLDKEVKEAVLHNAFRLLHARRSDKKRCDDDARKRAQDRLHGTPAAAAGPAADEEEEGGAAAALAYENKHRGLYERIYPCADEARTKMFDDLIEKSFIAYAQVGKARAASVDSPLRGKDKDKATPGRIASALQRRAMPPLQRGEARAQAGLARSASDLPGTPSRVRIADPLAVPREPSAALLQRDSDIERLNLTVESFVVGLTEGEGSPATLPLPGTMLVTLPAEWAAQGSAFLSYWLGQLDRHKRRKVIGTFHTNLTALVRARMIGPAAFRRAVTLIDFVQERMLSANGRGLADCLCADGSVRVAFVAPPELSPPEARLLALLTCCATQCAVAFYLRTLAYGTQGQMVRAVSLMIY
eukprot:m.66720 g.66720  ORF g.66720 m.66720 type:complete len:696 (-) comp7421_c0_seq2:1296-3383(-)